jgi:replicative DNA helicase
MSTLRIPPHNLEAETAVIGSILQDKKVFPSIGRVINANDFYNESHKVIFQVISDLARDGKATDVLTVANELEARGKLEKVGGSGILVGAVNNTPSASNGIHYAQIVKKHSLLRGLIIAGHEINELGYDTEKDINLSIEEASKKLLGVGALNRSEKTDMRNIISEFEKSQIEYAEAIISGKDILGIPTGFKFFDKATDGLQPHDLITVAAFTSVGKSGFTLNMVRNLINKGRRVVVFSLEMSQQDIVSRILALELNCHSYDVLKGMAETDADKYDQIREATLNISSKKLSIYTQLQTVDEVIMAMQEECLKEPVDLFVLDYIQNISSAKYMDEYSLLTDAVKRLQRTIAGLDSTLMIISQISNDSQKKQDVLNVQGKGTGSIRAASDLFLYLKNNGSEDEILSKMNTGEDIPMMAVINKNRITGRVFSAELARDQRTGKIFEVQD